MKTSLLVISVFFLSACALGQQEAPPQKPAGDLHPRGASTFMESGCPQCHTIRHSGGTRGPDLSAVGSRLKEDQIRAQIMKGGKEMPAFGTVLEASEINDLVDYLSSLKSEQKSDGKQ
jgi:ubiquinol-cytochrome c reductase cytochrome b subunit